MASPKVATTFEGVGSLASGGSSGRCGVGCHGVFSGSFGLLVGFVVWLLVCFSGSLFSFSVIFLKKSLLTWRDGFFEKSCPLKRELSLKAPCLILKKGHSERKLLLKRNVSF